MVKEGDDRWWFQSARLAYSCLIRYVAAGVLSKCVQSKDGCCLDPVVYHKLNTEIKWWIWQFAPGVRNSDEWS